MSGKSLLYQVKRLRRLMNLSEPPKDEDCFFQSLGVDGEAFNYDEGAALSASALDDWNSEEYQE